MLKLLLKTLGLIAALALSNAVYAVGMGGINVTTALGEPLNADVELVAVGKAESSKLSARLASPEAFKGAGLDYPDALPKLKFQIEARANGEPYLKITSIQPINEPFVSLLIELTWSSGQLMREYTFLLDPPGFKAEQPKAMEVQPLAPSAVGPAKSKAGESGAGAVKQEPMLMHATAPMDEKVFVAAGTASVNKPAEKINAGKSNVATGTIKVKSGDTLSKIARETKSPEVSLERMLVAMYRANEDAFDGNNLNRLKTGKILRIPEGDDLNKVAQVEAVKEIHAQAADWQAYRLKLAAAGGSVSEQAPKQEVSGKISTSVADKTPAAKDSTREVVRLSKGEAPGDKAAAGGNAKDAQDKMHATEEDVTARNKAIKDSNERIAMLEKNISAMQRLIELKSQPVSQDKPAPDKTGQPAMSKAEEPKIKPEAKPEVASAATNTTTLAQTEHPASAVSPAKPLAPKIETPPSLTDVILGEPLYLAGGAAALLGGVGFMLARHRKNRHDKEAAAIAGTNIVAPVAPSPDTGDFTKTATPTPILSTTDPDDVDPISEADLFLNFGRDVQAEEILKDALKKNPGNQQIRLKLLSIYANRKDTKTFSGVAREVQNSGDAAAWAQAAEMGRKLESGNPMYGSADDDAAVETGDATPDKVKTAQPAASLDFDLGLGEQEAGAAALDVPVDTKTEAPSGLDFDLGFGTPAETVPAAGEDQNTGEPSAPQAGDTDTTSVLDFDLGFDAPSETAAPAPAEMDFTSTMVLNVPPKVESKAAENIQAEATTLDFDITSVHPELPEQQAAEQANEPTAKSAPSLDDLIFDVTAAHPLSPAAIMEEVAEAETVAPAEAEDGIDFTLDFPATEISPADDKATPGAPVQDAAKELGAIDLGDINLNLDVPVSAPAEEVKDAHWHDVATKLDLARAYQEMGDASGAREILDEVLNEGDAQQRAAAEVMLQQLPA